MAERIRNALAKTELEVRGSLLSLSSSFGVTHRLGESDSVDDLIERADQALHSAKRWGRNRVVSFAAGDTLAEFSDEECTTVVPSSRAPAGFATPRIDARQPAEREIGLLVPFSS